MPALGPLRDRLGAAPALHDPNTAAARLGDVEAAFPAGFLTPPLRPLLLGIADHSPFLWRLIAQAPERFAALVEKAPEASDAAITARQRAAGRAGGTKPDLVAIGRALRWNRAEHALLVALADLGGLWDLPTVTKALSDFADASVGAAADALLLQAAGAGKLHPPDPGDPQAGSGLVVLGLGKLGGGELNYSSDIDLIVFFDAARAPLADGVEAKPFFAKVAQGIAKLLEERTAEGYVHRVDYRLRPDPGSTAVALSTDFAFDYYQSLGQNWERAAFIKARPIAGDREAGARFLAELRPFIWRKYFDFAAIADIHAMKRQIHVVRGHEALAVGGHDIKLGRGGIREIEFFVQTQQLVFGGRRPELRGSRTVPMLGRLTDAGWITEAARDELHAAYAFLRTIEHRLQMRRDEQTQRLPLEPDDLTAFARFCGFATRAAFEAALLHHAGRVQAHYVLLFETAPSLSAEVGDLVFSGSEDDPATLATLSALGFAEPARTIETVRGWHFGRRPAVRTARARAVLTELLPSLLQALGGTAEPDAALNTLDHAFGRMPDAAELLTILLAHERLRLLFADILGTAPRLAATVGSGPHVLDAVLDPDFVLPTTDAGAIAAQYRALVGSPGDHETFLDRSRDAARQLRFVTGARLLSGILSAAQAGEAYSGIAEAAVAASLAAVERGFAAEYGAVPKGRCAILAVGRLGSRQLTADSDLDLIVVYDFAPEDRTTTGPKAIDAVVAYNRLAQRLYAALTVQTRRGGLYAVDLRLRPGGEHSPTAVQVRGFVAYHQDEAEIWEHMVLTRARVIAGDAGLGGEIAKRIRETVARPRDATAVCAAVRDMRGLVAREKGHRGPLDLKLAPGALLDLEFLAQALVLGHAQADPDLVGATADAVLERAGARGILPIDTATRLADAYRLFDTVHHWQRLVGADGSAPSRGALARMATAMGVPSAETLVAQIQAERRATRKILLALRRPKH
ncbi:bifunctional [glutamine synthetase] adenylyltransferase/[glutamine synthetase]-adenylyl-L-tyrosine phosphorylase [Methylobacterium sp. WL30]|uniref:bifunctional [glutamine synthetase] adenylyltransferase/[glutamine synthetase]-adenylyl-L-tyrosine phosphorylase n=1 Tax=unclassified Methylobacterium TaxID=2615210 RepID=UPI0011CB011D|nr:MULTISPECIES: bifunctional [glutamine synthetase] adenylyltransferase/[glutamine synthetase]-adenylyl-L-tyrosine phosphorylase [unclassified Methylobacterium]TXN42064.1 bifunctional [glutamine synthetase] adenylyltransferase/[glutamine synthetase]-adenylyl-L-tyrosine phosphorylase [Methylobacterium sp. WL93]TXN52722.1 bifunctional [glutamine synthetase] adenylyltransferase/[glutamine synthetase]-adenylyl-L-tyrosine phosphorylase [Methylobacterium sp. WL119]TXN69085.1 bifunctional [glutamine s